MRESIEFSEVGYAYPGAGKVALEGFSLKIPRGAFIALVGASGAGKTTVVDILLGLLSPTQGRVLVDGREIASDLAGWRRSVGYIPQSVYLIDDTLRRNVAFGLSDAEIDEEKVWVALRAAQLETFALGASEGLDARVGERGVRISGGERQRIGIARALYHDPDVLILDEPTSALDRETEREIIRTISAQKGRKTVIVIAHRISTLRSCDAVYELAAGRLKGAVSYEELARAAAQSEEAHESTAQ